MENASLLKKICLKTYNYIANSVIGSIGGIMKIWNGTLLELSFSIATRHSIITIPRIIGMDDNLCDTNFYAPHTTLDRIKILQEVRTLLNSIHHPYKILAGDFNMVLNLGEKKGGLRILDHELVAFQSSLEALNLIDIPTSNDIYT